MDMSGRTALRETKVGKDIREKIPVQKVRREIRAGREFGGSRDHKAIKVGKE